MASPILEECIQDDLILAYGFMLFRDAFLTECGRLLWGTMHTCDLAIFHSRSPAISRLG